MLTALTLFYSFIYKRFDTGDFRRQILALEYSLSSLDKNLLPFTLWNYAPENTNERGDLWNDEDLSVFSRDQIDMYPNAKSIHAGGRALPALVRPYAKKVSGVPLRCEFRPFASDRRFEFEFNSNAFDSSKQASKPTQLFLPLFQYPGALRSSNRTLGVAVEVVSWCLSCWLAAPACCANDTGRGMMQVSDGSFSINHEAQLLE